MHVLRRGGALLMLLALGCGGGDQTGSDATADAGTDARSDSGTDTTADAGTDTTADAGTDATADAGTDATADAGTDATADAGTDIAIGDGAAGPDAETVSCPPLGWIADFDGDGIADCAFTAAGTGARLDLGFHRGVAPNVYLAATVLTPDIVPPGSELIALYDLDHDSRQDIIVHFPDPRENMPGVPLSIQLQLFRGQADGTFLAWPAPPEWNIYGRYAEGHYANITPRVGDFDGDGAPDLLTITSFPDLYAHYFWLVLRSAGGADFTTPGSDAIPSLRGIPFIVEVVDVNADGKLDVVVYARVTPNVPGLISYIGVSLGQADARFTPVARIAGTDDATGASVSDVNGDGKPDVVVTLPAGPTSFYGKGDGTFSTTAP